MMNQLVSRITEKTGISEDQAKSAAETVIGFLKEKMPAPIAGQLDNFISGEGGGIGGQAQNMVGGLGGMFGGGDKGE